MSYKDCFENLENNTKFTSDVSDSCEEDDIYHKCSCIEKDGRCCVNASCVNVATQTECVKCKSGCCNQNFIRRTYAELSVIETKDKGYGLFSTNSLVKGQFIIEFVGELINTKELMSRMSSYDGHLLVMQLKEGTYIDATNKGSISRFLNHSCSPNCRIEVWTVNSCYRVGVFALCDISPESELTIDYCWEPSNKPLTKCYCMSKNCRGYIEIIDYQQYTPSHSINYKPGMWLSAKNLPELAIIKDDETVRVDPNWLIGKRVKIWWDGNQQYFDSDVIDYICEKRKHVLKYLTEQCQNLEELCLDVAKAKWLWLDESRQEFVIKKKNKDDMNDSMSNYGLSESNGCHIEEFKEVLNLNQIEESTTLISDQLVNTQIVAKVMKTEVIHKDVVLRICMNEMTKEVPNFGFHNFHCQCVFAMSILSNKFQVKVSLPQAINSNTVTPPIAYLNATLENTILMRIYGINENVLHCIDYIKECELMIEEDQFKINEAHKKDLVDNQTAMFLYDWRISFPENDSDIYQYLTGLYGSEKISIIKNKLCLLTDENFMLSNNVKTNALQNINFVLMYQKYCQYLDLISKRLKFSESVILHSTSLYLRYCRFSNLCNSNLSEDLNDGLAVIAAIIVLTLKVRQEYKSKMLPKIVTVCYSVLFNRTEDSCSLPSDSFHYLRVNEKVIIIWNNILKYDLYVLDIKSLVLSNYNLICVTGNEIKMAKKDNYSANIMQKNGMSQASEMSKQNESRLNLSSTNDDYFDFVSNFLDLSLSICNFIIKQYSWIYESSVHGDVFNFSIVLFTQTLLSLTFDSVGVNGNSSRIIVSLNKILLSIGAKTIMMTKEQLLNTVDFVVTFFSVIALDDLLIALKSNSFMLSVVSDAVSLLTNVFIHSILKKIMPCLLDMILSHSNSPNSRFLSIQDLKTQESYFSSSFETSNDIFKSFEQQINNQSNSNQSDLKKCFTRRFPSLHDMKSDSSILKIPKAMVIQSRSIAKDVYTLSVSTDFIRHTSMSHINVEVDPTMKNVVHLTLVGIPSMRQLQREFKGRSSQSDYEFKCSSHALSEINMLHQLHSLALKSRTYCSYFIVPMEIIQIDTLSRDENDEFYVPPESSDKHTSYDTLGLYERFYLVTMTPRCVSLSKLLMNIGVENRKNNNSIGQITNKIDLDINFLIALYKDLFSSLLHCVKCGILFKWICLDQIFVSMENGTILMTGLDGAVYLNGKSNSDLHIKSSNRSNNSNFSIVEIKPLVPNNYLSNTAPEIVLGSKSSISSSLFIFATVCAHLLSGKPLIKPPDSEEKYIQYCFRILGTPKVMHFREFFNLPRSNIFGGLIKADDGSFKENRSQTSKFLTERCPEHLRSLPQTSTLITMLTEILLINPSKRLTINQISSSTLFQSVNSKNHDRMIGINILKEYFNKIGDDCSQMY